jgi:hypothetical protein
MMNRSVVNKSDQSDGTGFGYWIAFFSGGGAGGDFDERARGAASATHHANTEKTEVDEPPGNSCRGAQPLARRSSPLPQAQVILLEPKGTMC